MDPDPVIDEIHAYREQLAARFGYDIQALARYARELDAADKHRAVQLVPKRPELEPITQHETVVKSAH